tara:strand:+ start:817 stop:3402 length:2586 start_codon:yes stop_codon:yes gene_type:complete
MENQKINLAKNKMNEKEVPYQECLDTESDMKIAQDVNARGGKIYRNMSIEEAVYQTNADSNLYEIIYEHKPCAFYIDFDAPRKECDFTEEDVIKSLDWLIDDFIDHYELPGGPPGVNGENSSFHSQVSQSHSDTKISFHYKIETLILGNYTDLLCFSKKFFSHINDREQETHWIDPKQKLIWDRIDRSVYTRNRLWRMLGQSKFGQHRPLKIAPPHGDAEGDAEDDNNKVGHSLYNLGSNDPRDHLITYNKTGYSQIKIPKSWRPFPGGTPGGAKNGANPGAPITTKNNDIPYEEDKELQELIRHTKHKGVGYESWRMWIWALYGAGVPVDLIQELSQEADPESYDLGGEAGIITLIRAYDATKNKTGRDTLKCWAKQGGYEVNRHIERKVIPEDPGEKIMWIDLVKKFHGARFPSYDNLIESIARDVNRCVKYINGTGYFYRLSKNEPNKLSAALPTCSLYYNVFYSEKPVMCELHKLIKNNPLDFPLYNSYVFKPENYGVEPNDYNSWEGFLAKELPEDQIDMKLVTPLLNHIWDVLANSNPKYYNYILTWFATIIKTPYKKTEICLIIKGLEGDGKSCVSEFFRNNVFGPSLSFTCNGLQPLAQRFNGITRDKIFGDLAELTSPEEFTPTQDRLKTIITDNQICIENKGFEPIIIDNFVNLMATTNNTHNVRITKYDRRYAMFQSSSCHRGDVNYFNKFHELYKNQDNPLRSREAGNHVFSYFRHYAPGKMVCLRNIPNTQLRQANIDFSLNSVERFFRDLDKFDFLTIRKVGECWVSSKSGLFAQYAEYCNEFGIKKFSRPSFFRAIPTNIFINEGHTKVSGKNIQYIQLTLHDKMDEDGNIDNVMQSLERREPMEE